jgi:hypothetical protein
MALAYGDYPQIPYVELPDLEYIEYLDLSHATAKNISAPVLRTVEALHVEQVEYRSEAHFEALEEARSVRLIGNYSRSTTPFYLEGHLWHWG